MDQYGQFKCCLFECDFFSFLIPLQINKAFSNAIWFHDHFSGMLMYTHLHLWMWVCVGGCACLCVHVRAHINTRNNGQRRANGCDQQWLCLWKISISVTSPAVTWPLVLHSISHSGAILFLQGTWFVLSVCVVGVWWKSVCISVPFYNPTAL